MCRAPRGQVVYPEEQIHEECQQEFMQSNPHIEEVHEDEQYKDQTLGKRTAGVLKQGTCTHLVSCHTKRQALERSQGEEPSAEEEDVQYHGEHESLLEPHQE